jgi:preprotein translocase subunit SecA
MNRAGFPDDMPLESKMVTRGIMSAQGQVEARNFEIRKNVLKYDDVLSRQRTVIYAERLRVLEGEDMREQVQHFLTDTVTEYVTNATAEGSPEQWDLDALWTALKAVYPVSLTPEEIGEEAGGMDRLTGDMLLEEILSDARVAYQAREDELSAPAMRQLERRVVLSVLDRKWREHLYEMDYLKEGIGLRAMAQRDPLVEYQREGFQLFQAMTDAIKEESVGFLFNLEVTVQQPGAEQATDGGSELPAAGPVPPRGRLGTGQPDAPPTTQIPVVAPAAAPQGQQPPPPRQRRAAGAATEPILLAKGLDAPSQQQPLTYSAPSEDGSGSAFMQSSDGARRRASLHGEATAATSDGRTFPGTPRNAQCPCGSGKKYKVCHGVNEA